MPVRTNEKNPAEGRQVRRSTAHRPVCEHLTNDQSVQTFIDFMPVSASAFVLKIPLSTTVVVVVVGFLSTTVHFLVVASLTT